MITLAVRKLFFKLRFKGRIKRCDSYFDPFSISVSGGGSVEIGAGVYLGSCGWYASTRSDGLTGLTIEDGASIGRFAHVYSTNSVVIRSSAILAEGVYVSDNLHGYMDVDVPIKDQPLVQCKDVVIGAGSWIGEHVCIIGACVGAHSVVGANAVVTHDIPDYCVAVGAPARIIKRYDFERSGWYKTDADGNFVE